MNYENNLFIDYRKAGLLNGIFNSYVNRNKKRAR